MLTRKQCWRKAKNRSLSTSQLNRRAENEFENVAKITNNKKKNSFSDSDVIYSTAEPTGAINNREEIKKSINSKCKTLRFSSTLYVLLIPSRKEIAALSGNCLYWNDEDFIFFKKDAVEELRAYMSLKKITAKEAVKSLYQPKPSDLCPTIEPCSPSLKVIRRTAVDDVGAGAVGNDSNVEPNRICDNELEISTTDSNEGKTDEESPKSSKEANEMSSNSFMGSNSNNVIASDQSKLFDTGDDSYQNIPTEFKFISGIKTDIELNRHPTSASSSSGSTHHNQFTANTSSNHSSYGSSSQVLPLHTPSRGGSDDDNKMWIVKWKKENDGGDGI